MLQSGYILVYVFAFGRIFFENLQNIAKCNSPGVRTVKKYGPTEVFLLGIIGEVKV